MVSSLGSRIDTLIQTLGIRKVRFAESLKINQAYVTKLVNNERNPSDRLICDICRVYNVNESWLRTGEGDMFTAIDPVEQLANEHRLGPGGRALLSVLAKAFATLAQPEQDLLYETIRQSLIDSQPQTSAEAAPDPPRVDDLLLKTLDQIVDDYEAAALDQRDGA